RGQTRAVRVYHLDVPVLSGTVRGEGDAGAVRGPRPGPGVVARDVRQAGPARAIGVHHEDLLVVPRVLVRADVGDVGDILPVGRPGGLAGATNIEGSLLGTVGVHHGDPRVVPLTARVSDAGAVRGPSGPVAAGEACPAGAVG